MGKIIPQQINSPFAGQRSNLFQQGDRNGLGADGPGTHGLPWAFIGQVLMGAEVHSKTPIKAYVLF